jgi:hypothetical protein
MAKGYYEFMQTFLPYSSFSDSASVLDYRRLGKQRVETLQILKSLLDPGYGWKNHPAVKMWVGFESALSAYGVEVCKAWLALGYKDTCLEKISSLVEPSLDNMPTWIGDQRLHDSHKSNLLRKMPEHYYQFFGEVNPDIPYFWPAQSTDCQNGLVLIQ